MSKRIDTASRRILAPAEVIYQAFATAEAMTTWLPPEGMTGTMLEFTFREGGIYHMRLTYTTPQPTAGKTSEDTDEVKVRFVRLVPHQQIDQVVIFKSDAPVFSGEMRMLWILEPFQNGTLVTVHCEDVPVGIRPENHQAGLASTLSNLAAFTESAHDTQPAAPG